jgi:hypothetical protein
VVKGDLLEGMVEGVGTMRTPDRPRADGPTAARWRPGTWGLSLASCAGPARAPRRGTEAGRRLLQETDGAEDSEFPQNATAEIGLPHVAYRGMKSYNGVADLLALAG